MFETYYINVRLRTVERVRDGCSRKFLKGSHASMLRLARWARLNRGKIQCFTPYSFGWAMDFIRPST